MAIPCFLILSRLEGLAKHLDDARVRLRVNLLHGGTCEGDRADAAVLADVALAREISDGSFASVNVSTEAERTALLKLAERVLVKLRQPIEKDVEKAASLDEEDYRREEQRTHLPHDPSKNKQCENEVDDGNRLPIQRTYRELTRIEGRGHFDPLARLVGRARDVADCELRRAQLDPKQVEFDFVAQVIDQNSAAIARTHNSRRRTLRRLRRARVPQHDDSGDHQDRR